MNPQLKNHSKIMGNNILITLFSIFTICSSGITYSQIDSNTHTAINTIIPTPIDTTPPLKKNTIFLEIGGNAFIYSVNYDRLFDVSNKIKLSSRIGIHFTNEFPLQYYRTLSIPVEFSGLYSISGNKHFLEVGVGLSYLNSSNKVTKHTEDVIALALRLGYRFQKPEGGLFVKIGFVPLYDLLIFNPDPSAPHNTWWISGGIGIGYSF